MLDTNSLLKYDSLDTIGTAELQQRLSLYQVFLKLYDHHRGLLDEILGLESPTLGLSPQPKLPFIQGVVRGDTAYLVTNLLGHTLALEQPQSIWTIGRDARQVALPLRDQRISRCHAAIRCVDSEFQFLDLDSSNGSFINSEPVRRAVYLQDGDKIRLGSVSFSFFICREQRSTHWIPDSLLQRIEQSDISNRVDSAPVGVGMRSPQPHTGGSKPIPDDTDLFLRSASGHY